MSIRRVRGKFEFKENKAALNNFKKTAPKIIANDSLNWFLEGFKNGGGQTDDSLSGWSRRKKGSKRDAGRAILVDTGALKRDIKVRNATFKEILIGTTRIAYARRHNEGITDRLGRQMPKREFIGDSKKLAEKNGETLIKLMNKVFKI